MSNTGHPPDFATVEQWKQDAIDLCHAIETKLGCSPEATELITLASALHQKLQAAIYDYTTYTKKTW